MDFDYKTYITSEKLLSYYESMLTANKNSSQSILNIFRQQLPSLSSYSFPNGTEVKLENKFKSFKHLINQIESYVFGPEFKKSFSAMNHSQAIDDQTQFPLRHLLFWAAMLGDFKMVQVVYVHLAKYEGGGIIAALALATIFKQAARLSSAIQQSTIYRKESTYYEQIAVDILTKTYQKANDKMSVI